MKRNGVSGNRGICMYKWKITVFTMNGGKYVGFVHSDIYDTELFNREFFNKALSGDWCCLINELGTITIRTSEIEAINVQSMR